MLLRDLDEMDVDVLSLTPKNMNHKIDASMKSRYASAKKGEPQPAYVYLAPDNGKIQSGMLFGLGWNEQMNMPQWKLDMDELFGEKQWICAHTFKAIGDKKVFLYEAKAQIELMDNGNIISEKSLYGVSSQEEFIQFVINLPDGQEYAIFTCKSIDDDQAMQWQGEKGVAECLGVYVVDKVKSILEDKFILRKLNHVVPLNEQL
jgi:hypothetical protein